jgi:hypothetical protein
MVAEPPESGTPAEATVRPVVVQLGVAIFLDWWTVAAF